MTSSEATERQPLLPKSLTPSLDSKSSEASDLKQWIKSKKAVLNKFISNRNTIIISCVFALQFLSSFAKHVIEVPVIRLLEIAICNQYYRGRIVDAQDISEKLCKVAPVQGKLSVLVGWKFSFDALPGLLTAIYYGSVADRSGRKPVLVLVSTGIFMSLIWLQIVCYGDKVLPVKLVWASSVFIFLGGGQRVFKSILFTIIADTIDPVYRTRCIYLLSSIPHVVTLIAPPFANLFMRISIWLPFQVACGFLIISCLVTWMMPETLKYREHNGSSHVVIAESVTPILPGDQLHSESHMPLLQSRPEESDPASEVQSSWTQTIREILSLFRIPTLSFVFLLFFLKPIALISKAFTFQFASESFGWKIRQTTWLRVSQAAGAALITLAFLPIFSVALIPRRVRPRDLDLGIIRGSLFIAIVGFGVLWQARANWMLVIGLFTCGLSEGLEPALQGLGASLIDQSLNARMFTTIAVIETVAKLIGGPLMARLFSIGRRENHGSNGINFLVASVIFTFLEGLAWTVKVK